MLEEHRTGGAQHTSRRQRCHQEGAKDRRSHEDDEKRAMDEIQN